MCFRVSWIGCAVLNCALLQASELKLGHQAPELVVRDCTNTLVRLSDYHQKKDAVLFALPKGGLLTSDVRDNACRQVERLNVIGLFLSADSDADRRLFEPAQSATIMIDSSGVVRRIQAGQVLTGSHLVQFVEIWRNGKGVFNAFCARCHGEDGALDICEDVKPLVGIGNRLTAEQIRARLRIGELDERQVLIRGQFFKRQDVDAVIAYVSGP